MNINIIRFGNIWRHLIKYTSDMYNVTTVYPYIPSSAHVVADDHLNEWPLYSSDSGKRRNWAISKGIFRILFLPMRWLIHLPPLYVKKKQSVVPLLGCPDKYFLTSCECSPSTMNYRELLFFVSLKLILITSPRSLTSLTLIFINSLWRQAPYIPKISATWKHRQIHNSLKQYGHIFNSFL